MPKKINLNPKSVIPSPKELVAEAQKGDPEKINKTALRRSKVKELSRMGYGPYQIANIINKGIKVGKETIILKTTSETVANDIEYIRQEDSYQDVDFREKRAEIRDKLDFLYQRAIQEYMNAKGATRATFMNTSLSILSKIMEIEGVKSPENLNINLNAEAKISQFAAEIHKLSENDKSTILAAIRKVRKQRRDERIGHTRIPSGKSRISVQTSNNEGVS